MLFKSYDKTLLAAITLTAVLYHTLNHAFFKSLLFLATGSVLHATHERSLGKLGGLIHRMPWVAWLALVGTLAIAGLPPLNGFVSEWLLLQAFLFTPSLPQSFVNMLVPLAAAALVLAVALAAYVMVKFYGVIFLGRPREANLAYAQDAGILERVALVWLAIGLRGARRVSGERHRAPRRGEHDADRLDRRRARPELAAARADQRRPLELQPAHLPAGHRRRRPADDADRASPLSRPRAQRTGVGLRLPAQTPRMQDTAEGFGQPIRQVFRAFFRIERTLPTPVRHQARNIASRSGITSGTGVYLPIAHATERVARVVGQIQQGRISVYLIYSFCTLLALLFFVR